MRYNFGDRQKLRPAVVPGTGSNAAIIEHTNRRSPMPDHYSPLSVFINHYRLVNFPRSNAICPAVPDVAGQRWAVMSCNHVIYPGFRIVIEGQAENCDFRGDDYKDQ
jgi:hypothetical protein